MSPRLALGHSMSPEASYPPLMLTLTWTSQLAAKRVDVLLLGQAAQVNRILLCHHPTLGKITPKSDRHILSLNHISKDAKHTRNYRQDQLEFGRRQHQVRMEKKAG